MTDARTSKERERRRRRRREREREREAMAAENTSGRPHVAVLTISDRASRGVYEDESGPRVVGVLKEYIATDCVYELRCIPDEQEVSWRWKE